MASPFAIFRKHERLLMAIAGVMAMIAFVFFDPLFGMRSGRGGARTLSSPRPSSTATSMRQTSGACSAPGH